MKKIVIGILVMASFAVSNISYAEGKIVVFNIQAAILNTEVAQKRLKEFEAKAEIADMKAEYEGIVAKMKKLDQDAKTNGVTWSQEQKDANAKQMEYERANLELAARKLQNESNTISTAIIKDMEAQARAVLQDLIKSEGIGLALNANAVQFADSSYDITAKITDRLNQGK